MTIIGNPLFIPQQSSPTPTPTSKNIQIYYGYNTTNQTTYTATGTKLTVAKTGTYKISWIGCRNSSSGTSGSRFYLNDVAQDSARTTFDTDNKLIQCITLTNVSLTQNDVVEIYARARTTSYYMSIGNLIIEEQ